jgi:hypothetical protein
MLQKIKNYHLSDIKQTQWIKNITTRLVTKGITPNEIALSSMVFAQVASFAFLLAFCFNSIWFTSCCLIIAIIGILLRLLCNVLVDMVEKEGGVHSPFSVVYHTFADRYSDVVIYLGMGYGLWMFGWSAYVGWAAALCAVINAYIDLFVKVYRLKQTFSDLITKLQPIILVIVTLLTFIISGHNRQIIYACLILFTLNYLLVICLKAYVIINNLDE